MHTNIDPNLGENTLLAKDRDTITVKFTTDERIKGPTATINENIVEVRPQSDDDTGKKWEFDYDVVDGINVDQTPFQITGANDSYGNALVAFPEATTDNASKFVRIDTKNPELKDVKILSVSGEPKKALNLSENNEVKLELTFSEEIDPKNLKKGPK